MAKKKGSKMRKKADIEWEDHYYEEGVQEEWIAESAGYGISIWHDLMHPDYRYDVGIFSCGIDGIGDESRRVDGWLSDSFNSAVSEVEAWLGAGKVSKRGSNMKKKAEYDYDDDFYLGRFPYNQCIISTYCYDGEWGYDIFLKSGTWITGTNDMFPTEDDAVDAAKDRLDRTDFNSVSNGVVVSKRKKKAEIFPSFNYFDDRLDEYRYEDGNGRISICLNPDDESWYWVMKNFGGGPSMVYSGDDFNTPEEAYENARASYYEGFDKDGNPLPAKNSKRNKKAYDEDDEDVHFLLELMDVLLDAGYDVYTFEEAGLLTNNLGLVINGNQFSLLGSWAG